MLRVSGLAASLLAYGVLSAACGVWPVTPTAPGVDSTDPAKPDQSTIFFPEAVDTYGVKLIHADRDHLAELYALRQINPCGFVDEQILSAHNHRDYSYSYTAVHKILTTGVAPISAVGGDGCTIAFPSTRMGLALRVLPGESRSVDTQFHPNSAHPGVMERTSPVCAFRVALPLTELSGAPRSMRDPIAEVSPADVTNGRSDFKDTSLCQLAEAIAGDIAANVPQKGIPAHSEHDSTAATFLTSDPCAAALDLHAVGFIWNEPPADAQWATTWRHPGVCDLQLGQSNGRPDVSSAVVKYGLAVWSDGVVESPSGQTPARSEQDDTVLFDFTTNNETACRAFILGKSSVNIEPVSVGTGVPDLVPPTPVVTVQLSMPKGSNCAETAKQAAVAAVKRAT